MTRIGYVERDRIFGAPCQPRRLVTVTTPWLIRVQVHELIADVFLDACRHARAEVPEWNPKRIDHYACRTVRGSTLKSLHAYGLAFDFFATGPGVVPPGGVWTPDDGLPPAFARCFVEQGFTWGATFTRRDVPHLEWARGVPSVLTVTHVSEPQEDDMFTEEDRRLLQGVYGFAINTERVLPEIVGSIGELRAKLAEVDAGNVTPEEFVAAFRDALAP